MLNFACIFPLKGSSTTGQPLAVDSSQSVSIGACAAPLESVGATFHHKGEEGETKQDICQGRNQEQ